MKTLTRTEAAEMLGVDVERIPEPAPDRAVWIERTGSGTWYAKETGYKPYFGDDRRIHGLSVADQRVSGEREDLKGLKRPRLRHELVTLPANAVLVLPVDLSYAEVPF